MRNFLPIGADRDLFEPYLIWDKLLMQGKLITDILSYELSSVLFALVRPDDSLRKTNKNVLFSMMQGEKFPRSSKALIRTTTKVYDSLHDWQYGFVDNVRCSKRLWTASF